MSAAAEKISVLRAALARADRACAGRAARAALGHAEADACLKGGILKGALHEVFSAEPGDEAAAGGFVAALAARVAADRRVLWSRTDFAALEHGGISPLGLLELGLDPARFLLLHAPDAVSILRAGLDALSCAALGAIVLEIPGAPRRLDLSASRRLVLAAAQSGVTVFLLRLDVQAEASATETRWLIRAARSTGHLPHSSRGGGTAWEWGFPRFEAELVRHRHGRNGHWVMEWNCDDGLFRAADSGAVVSTASDRPPQPENTQRVA